MALESDVVLNIPKFNVNSIPEDVREFNKKFAALTGNAPAWYDIGPSKYREMNLKGETAFPAPVLLDCASPFQVPSREAGRTIPCRVIRPEGDTPVKGVFMHIHGGGWVLASEAHQDGPLKQIVDALSMATISVGYRLAPEHPFPAAPEDCYDVAEWLVDNAEKEFGAPLKFICGDSAGAQLTTLSALHLLSHESPKYSQFQLKGLLLNFGVFDLSKTPSCFTFKRSPAIVLDEGEMDKFIDAFLPDKSFNRKSPSVSPLYFNFSALPPATKLPPALFLCGTEDLLLDDTVFMSAKWQMAGGEAIVKIVPGAPHGFIGFPPDSFQGVLEGLETVSTFLEEKVGS
ncbi:hypothetical protein AJ80_02498 [Polytolypa hystricis UAMH7299]|uniref:Alpha/beta hydrolase fold-3 domain-containing protein n=1 Tax=Polytolypa hystricis (strain UAMH7299) TaxID=1447883 RepID=A0A2B7YR87_POLH7|nr:hypothetical protein AJ80_02498 [Polytolypa hystricis UAMH7299]